MTNVSKQKLNSTAYKEMQQQFADLLATISKSTAKSFYEELFTPSEQIMFIKRFGAIFMLSEGYAPYTISTRIGISVSTAQRIEQRYQAGFYQTLLGKIPKKQRSALLELLKNLTLAQVSTKARRDLLKQLT